VAQAYPEETVHTHLIGKLRRESPMGEPEIAAASVVMALTATVGVMVSLLAAVQGGVALIALPTAALLVSMARHATVASAWVALAAWAALVPMAMGMGTLAPALMMVVCLGLAIGPGRVAAWVQERMKVSPPPADPGAMPESVGWIEDDPRFS
jgi:hypothetical protein